MKELDFLSNKKADDTTAAPTAGSQDLKSPGWLAELKKQFSVFRVQLSGSNKVSAEIVATDLIQSEVITYFNWKKNISIFIVLLAIDFLMLFGADKLLTSWESDRLNDVNKIKAVTDLLDQQVAQAEGNLGNIQRLQKKLDLVKGSLDNHIYWTNFFEFLEKNTLTDVFYDNGFSGDVEGSYMFPAHTKDFRYLAEQIFQLRKNSNVISASTNGGDVSGPEAQNPLSFSIDLKINPVIFLKTEIK